ncbi:MAG: hypothetical protein HWE23_16930 [Rhodobacteraceae bacterium]|nr:hypothetical protein [Paracoccaceae bacterium]
MNSPVKSFRLTIDNVACYAMKLWSDLDALDTAEWSTETIQVAGRRLELRSPSRYYLDLCLDNLVQEAFDQSEPVEVTEVIVLDRQDVPSLLSARWDTDNFSIKAFMESLADENLSGVYDRDADFWQFYDHEAKRGLYILRSPASVPPWEPAFPLRNFFHWSCQGTSQGLLHAGTVGVDGEGVLIVGPGGSGKSGTTLAAILSDMDSVGDDYVLASLQDDLVIAQPIISKMKQDSAGLKRVGLNSADEVFEGPNWQQKYCFDFTALGRGKRADYLKINAILLPRISLADKTTFTRASGLQAMGKLSPSSLHQLTGDWKRTVQFSASICRRLPAFHMNLGTDAKEISDSLRQFLKGQMQ